jgi:GNAT superfamily N-acetyltransferase
MESNDEPIIKKATSSDLLGIMYLLRQSIPEMNMRGNVHWNMHYPNHDIITRDIENDWLFIVKVKSYLIGMFVLNSEQVEEYNDIKWSADNEKSLVIHRMVIHPKWKGKNIESQMLDFIEHYTSEKGYEALRLDLFGGNVEELDFFTSNSFKEKGEFLMSYQKFPFKCFEKTVKK